MAWWLVYWNGVGYYVCMYLKLSTFSWPLANLPLLRHYSLDDRQLIPPQAEARRSPRLHIGSQNLRKRLIRKSFGEDW